MISSRYGSFLKKTQKQNAWFSLRWRLAISLHIFNVLGCNQIYLMSVVVLADNTIGRNVTCRSFFPPTSFRKPLSPASNPLHTRKFAQLRIVFKVCPSSKFIAEQMRVPTHGEISKKSFFYQQPGKTKLETQQANKRHTRAFVIHHQRPPDLVVNPHGFEWYFFERKPLRLHFLWEKD